MDPNSRTNMGAGQNCIFAELCIAFFLSIRSTDI
jgi:hypothetical protein